MSHLSLVARNPTARFLEDVNRLKLGQHNGRYKPHKLLLILAVAQQIESGSITRNRVYLNDDLRASFKAFCKRYMKRGDWSQIAPPFFHLRSSPFWNHKVKEGRESVYRLLTTSGGGEGRIHDNIEYAFLSDEAFAALQDDQSCAEIIEALHFKVLTLEMCEVKR